MEIYDFDSFCRCLCECGFSMGGGSAKGVLTVIPFSWEEQERGDIDSPIRWHTGDPDKDPWEWRMRVLEERNDIAYSKLFFRTSGYITKEWYPEFFAVRRNGSSFQSAYADGTLSREAKRIYEVVSAYGEVALHEIKQLGGFGKDEASAFEKAIVELQMRMFITMCGRAQKVNSRGESYGWSSTVFCTAEHFWEQRGLLIPSVSPNEAFDKISSQILRFNPNAKKTAVSRFIKG